MALYPNELDLKNLIDISETLVETTKQFGRYNHSGLFRKEGVTTQDVGFMRTKAPKTKMTGATSRLERDAWKVDSGKKDRVGLGTASYKLTDSVQYEDLAFRVNNWADIDPTAREKTVGEAVSEKLVGMQRTMEQNQEYSVFTAMQGVQRDTADGEALVDMFEVLGTTRLTKTIDLTQSTGVLQAINELTNQLIETQTYGSGFSAIEIIVADDVMTALTSHPELITLYESAMTGRGMEYVNSPFLSGRVNDLNRNLYGFVRKFDINGVTFSTYPQKFRNYLGEAVDAIPNGKGFTTIHGVAGLYQAKFVPAPYLPLLGSKGQENYVWQTPVKDNTHFELYQESHGAYFMQEPTLSVDLTFIL